MEEYRSPEGGFRHFNDFFYRELADGARPLAESDAVFPADGRHLAIPEIGRGNVGICQRPSLRSGYLAAGTGYETTWAVALP